MTTKKLLVALFLLFIISWPSFSLATSGCCSWHGGVCGCDESVGRQVCCDGSYSPSCGCAYNPPKPKVQTSTLTKSTKTDCESVLSSTQSLLTSTKSDLQKAKDESDNKSKILSEQSDKLTNMTNTIDSQNWWLGILIIGLIISIAINFYKSRN